MHVASSSLALSLRSALREYGIPRTLKLTDGRPTSGLFPAVRENVHHD